MEVPIMRIIIYTGKGGVGKTSIAAATAYRLAAEGKRTIVLSTDAYPFSLLKDRPVLVPRDPNQSE